MALSFRYEADKRLVEAGFTSVMHLAVLEGLKQKIWYVETLSDVTVEALGEKIECTKKKKRYYTPQISMSFEGGWDLNYPKTVEMRTYGHRGSLALDVKQGDNWEISPTEAKFCREVIRLWKVCEEALLTSDEPNFAPRELETVVRIMHERGKMGLKHRLDGWKKEQYEAGAMIVLALAKAVNVSPYDLARSITLAFGNPFHKSPYVEVKKSVRKTDKN